MDLTNNQAPMPTPEPKNKTWLWILIVIIVALLAGGGVYAWQNQQAQKQNQTATEKVRNEMQQKITEAENKLADLQTKLEQAAPTGRKTYTSKDGFIDFQYPETWPVNEDADNIIIKHPAFFEGGTVATAINISHNQITSDQFIKNKLTEDSVNKFSGKTYTEIGFKPATKFTMTNAMGIKTTYIFYGIGASNYVISYNSYNEDEQRLVNSLNISNNGDPIDFQTTLWCQATPIPNEIGYSSYPAHPSMDYLSHLGSLLTAYDCGAERVGKIFGVKGDEYTLGSQITLKDRPDQKFIQDLKSIGYQCVSSQGDENCLEWKLNKTVKIKDLLILRSYIQSGKIINNDCINCG